MKKQKAPVILFGPPLQYQPWIRADVELIRNHLQDKYGLVGVVYVQALVPATGYPGYSWFGIGLT